MLKTLVCVKLNPPIITDNNLRPFDCLLLEKIMCNCKQAFYLQSTALIFDLSNE